MWKLIEAMPVEATMDNSGIYVIINRLGRHRPCPDLVSNVRADLMTNGGLTVVSFIGQAENVRKRLIAYLTENQCTGGIGPVSLEHASYIGKELYRASVDPMFVQD